MMWETLWRVTPLFLFTAMASFLAAGDASKLPKKAPRTESTDPLLKLAPDERMRFLAKVLNKDKDFLSATRGPLTESIVERGNLEAVESSPLICRVRARGIHGKNSTVATIIKWVIDDGAQVKKGDKLIEFDSAAHADLLKAQKLVVAKAEAALKLAVDELERNAKKQILVQELDRQRELEQDIGNCVMTAPRDGMVVYYVPDQARPGAGSNVSIVAQGEPVREGQKLLLVVDLARMAVNVRVHEAMIFKVRAPKRSPDGKVVADGQAVKVRVDAFPGRPFTGKVSEVADVPSQADFFAKDVKLYAVRVTLDGENKGLKPGMSAEASIHIGDSPDCLRLPAPAVLGKGKDIYCYVLTGKELHVRKVTLGKTDGKLVEISSGLKEAEPVLGNPSVVFKRLADSPQPDAK